MTVDLSKFSTVSPNCQKRLDSNEMRSRCRLCLSPDRRGLLNFSLDIVTPLSISLSKIHYIKLNKSIDYPYKSFMASTTSLVYVTPSICSSPSTLQCRENRLPAFRLRLGAHTKHWKTHIKQQKSPATSNVQVEHSLTETTTDDLYDKTYFLIS